MFQLQGAIIRPLYKNRSLSGFLVYDWDPNCLHYWDIVVYSVVVWLKMRLNWKAMEYCAKIANILHNTPFTIHCHSF